MRAGTTTASIVRRTGGLAKASIVTAIIAASLVAPSAASAAKGGGAVATTYSTIDLASSQLRTSTPLARGSNVAFVSKVVGLKGTEYPMVYVECYSNVDGSLLYGQLDHPDATFVLGGGSSRWWLVDPSPDATCYSHLYAYGGKTRGGNDVIRELTDPAQPVLSFLAEG